MQFTERRQNGDSQKTHFISFHLHSTYALKHSHEWVTFLRKNVHAINGNEIAGRMINERNFIDVFTVLHISKPPLWHHLIGEFFEIWNFHANERQKREMKRWKAGRVQTLKQQIIRRVTKLWWELISLHFISLLRASEWKIEKRKGWKFVQNPFYFQGCLNFGLWNFCEEIFVEVFIRKFN